MDWNELNFTKICRCCKRVESGLISIFAGNPTNPTYPEVKEMLRSIASLNVQENDGLPSRVCPSCLNNIQDAFTFILQVILIDEELRQILLARGKQADDLLQDTSAGSVKKENGSAPVEADAKLLKHSHDSVSSIEDVCYSLTANGTLHGSADNSNDLVVKPENVPAPKIEEANKLQLPQEQSKGTPKLAYEVCNKAITSLEIHKSIKYSDITITKEDNKINQPSKSISFTAVDDNANGTANIDKDLDTAENVDQFDEVDVENVEISPKLRRTPRRKKPTSKNLADTVNMFYCKWCKYSTARKSHLNRHMGTHFKDKAFRCSKCKRTFSDRPSMLCHWQKCRISEGVRSLTQQDPKEENCPKSSTTRGKTTSNKFDCKICAYSSAKSGNFDRHMQTHLNDKSFRCSKCKRSFTDRSSMLRHWQKCKVSEEVKSLKDPMKIKTYDTVTETEENCPKSPKERKTNSIPANALNKFRCKMCAYSTTYKGYLNRHMGTHLKNRAFRCSKCKRSFTDGSSMLCHWQKCKVPQEVTTLKDPITTTEENCPKSLKSSKQRKTTPILSEEVKSLKDHMKIKTYDTVTEAEENYPKSSKERKTNSIPANASNKLRCKMCAYSTSYKGYLYRHMRTHLNDQAFRCSKCKRTFTDGSSMLCHWQKCKESEEVTETEENCPKSRPKQRKTTSILANALNPFRCTMCKYSTARKSHLTRHMITHLKCSKCKRIFTERSSLLLHLKKCRKSEEVISLSLQDLKDPMKMKEYYTEENCVESSTKQQKTTRRCKLCGYSNANLTRLKRHLLTHSKNRPFRCSKCNEGFADKTNMGRHWQNCKPSKEGTSSASPTLDLNDSLKMKQYYTVTEIEVQNSPDDNDLNVQRAEKAKLTVFKCKLCEYSSACILRLMQHLHTHSEQVIHMSKV